MTTLLPSCVGFTKSGRHARSLVRNQWRAEQTSNAFELVPTAAAPVPRCDGQSVRGTRKAKIIATVTVSVPLPDPAEVAAARAALEARAREMEAKLAMKWCAA